MNFSKVDKNFVLALFYIVGFFTQQKATKRRLLYDLLWNYRGFLPWIFFEQPYYPALLAFFADLYGLENWQSDT